MPDIARWFGIITDIQEETELVVEIKEAGENMIPSPNTGTHDGEARRLKQELLSLMKKDGQDLGKKHDSILTVILRSGVVLKHLLKWDEQKKDGREEEERW